MNLDGLPIGDSLGKINHEDSNLVDLIWFPTEVEKRGYLGVAAVALCYSRIVDADCAGTEVITSVSLRLLTSQQFRGPPT